MAIMSGMGIKACGKRVFVQREIEREEMEKAKASLKCGKATDMRGITSEFSKSRKFWSKTSNWSELVCLQMTLCSSRKCEGTSECSG